MSPWSQQILSGDLRAPARPVTAVENRHPKAEKLLQELFRHTGKSKIIGITGSPGAGKSTLVDRFIHELRRENKAVGVLTVDATSPYTGGGVASERIRKVRHPAAQRCFFRSMGTAGCP